MKHLLLLALIACATETRAISECEPKERCEARPCVSVPVKSEGNLPMVSCKKVFKHYSAAVDGQEWLFQYYELSIISEVTGSESTLFGNVIRIKDNP